MPFDAITELDAADVAKLKVALAGVTSGWGTGSLGLEGDGEHCLIGWLLVATDYDPADATRLALDYVYPALPPSARRHKAWLEAIWEYNDGGGQARVVRVLTEAVRLAQAKAHASR